MSNFVSAWSDKEFVYLVSRINDNIKINKVKAKYSFFMTGLDDEDRYTLARDRRVSSISFDDKYTRIDCDDYWSRKNLIELLEETISRNNLKSEILEGDVYPLQRLMADNLNLGIDPDIRLMYIDIETDSRKTFTQAVSGQSKILTWAVCDKDGKNLVSACCKDDSRASEIYILEQLIEVMRDYDCIVAWYGDGFDFPVIQNRSDELGMKYKGGDVPWLRWSWLDHLEVKKKHDRQGSGDEKQSNKLDYVAKMVLGEDEGKFKFDAGKTWEYWKNGGKDRELLLRYNEQDTLLLPRIEDKTGFINLQLAVCQICRIFPDTRSLQATVQGDGFLLGMGSEYNHRWATKRPVYDADKFLGAYVMEPTRLGVIENVHVADFAGLYPSIMRTFNMSPETKINKKIDDDKVSFETDDVEPEVEKGICQLPKRSTWFYTPEVKKGMFTIALDQLVARRADYTMLMKKEIPGTNEHEMYRRLSQAIKVVANSFYGILGSKYSRFFDPEAAEGVTQTGKWLIHEVINESKKVGLVPFYADTDSVFVSGDKDEFIEIVNKMNNSWTERLKVWGIDKNRYIDLDFEKTFFRVIMIKKKRYVGKFLMYKGKDVPEGAEPEIKGLEFKRGDVSLITRQFQKDVIFRLFDKELPKAQEMKDLVLRWKDRAYKKPFGLEDVVISQAISKPLNQYKNPLPPHVRVALLLKEKGEDVKEGTKIEYVVVPGTGTRINAIPVSDLEYMDQIDRVYYWSKQFYPPVERVLEKVYPDYIWSETRAERDARELESKGQCTLFDTINPDFGLSTKDSVKRRRKKKKVDRVLHINIFDKRNLNDLKCQKMINALKAIIKAYPGNVPVTIFVHVEKENKVVEIDIRESIKEASETVSSLKRILSKPDFFDFLEKI
jgi:DNA polymerase I